MAEEKKSWKKETDWNKKLRTVIKAKKIQQKQIAEDLKIAKSTFNNNINNAKPDLVFIETVLNYLEVPLFSFFMRDDDDKTKLIPPGVYQEQIVLLQLINNLPRQKRMEILNELQGIIQHVLSLV